MQLVQEAGPLAWAHLALTVLGLFWAVVMCALYGMRWKVPPVVALAPLGAHALLVIAGIMLGMSRVNSAIGSIGSGEPELRATLLAAGFSEVLSHAQLAAAAVPSAATLLLAGLLSGCRGKRAWGVPVVTAGITFFIVGAIGASLSAHGDVVLVLGRVVLYGGAGLVTAAALTGHHALDSSREGGIVAAVSFAVLVAAGESMVMGSGWARLFGALASIDPASRAAVVAAGSEELQALYVFSWAAILLAIAPAVIALLRPAAELTEEEVMMPNNAPSGMRWFGGALGLLIPALWVGALLAAGPADILQQITKASPTPSTTPR